MLTWLRRRGSQWSAFHRSARRARLEGGVSVWRQFLEAGLLRARPGSLGLSEYHDYRLHVRGLGFAEKRRFVGWRGESPLDDANDRRWHAVADDKVRLDALLADAGLPRPLLLATYRAHHTPCPGVDRIDSPEGLARWLRECSGYPLFAKPAHSGFGRGAVLLKHYVRAEDSVEFDDGSTMAVDQFVRGLPNPESKGYLFQACLRTHPALAALLSGRVSTLRVMSLGEAGQEPFMFRAVWKVPRKHNIVDNYESGSLGNFLGQVDLLTGAVVRVFTGHGLDMRGLERHPDSGGAFSGLRLPDFDRVAPLVASAARLMPEFRFQHWDVALSDRGPVLVEVNLFAAGGTELSQLADGRGLLDPALLRVVRAARATSRTSA